MAVCAKHGVEKLPPRYRCKACGAEKAQARRDADPTYAGRLCAKTRVKLRLEVLAHYGGSPPKCSCCSESTVEFLVVDHLTGGGNKQRRLLRRGGTGFYFWLRTTGYPDGFGVLCQNCNWGKRVGGGICPHKRPIPITHPPGEGRAP